MSATRYNETKQQEVSDIVLERALNGIETDRGNREITQEKSEVLDVFTKDIEENLRHFIVIQTRDETMRHGSMRTFHNEQEKLTFWHNHIAGYVFERLTEIEHQRSTQKIDVTETENPLDDVALSHIIIEIAKHPKDYGLMKKTGNQIMDAVYATMDKDTHNVEIVRIGEAKLPEKLDDRAQHQLSTDGSRKTMTLLVEELNELLTKGDYTYEQEPLRQLKALLGESKLSVAKNLGIDVIVPSNRETPDHTILKQKQEADQILYGKELRRLRNFLEGGSEKPYDILGEMELGSIVFLKSAFNSHEVTNIVNAVMETTELNLDFPGEIRKENITTETKEILTTPQERVAKIVTEVDNIEKYLLWLHAYLDIGRNADLKNDRKKYSNLRVENMGNATYARHETSGITITTKSIDKNEATEELRTAIQSHIEDWQLILADLDSEHVETIGSGKHLSIDQKHLIESITKSIRTL